MQYPSSSNEATEKHSSLIQDIQEERDAQLVRTQPKRVAKNDHQNGASSSHPRTMERILFAVRVARVSKQS
jgi:hypothetical protein